MLNYIGSINILTFFDPTPSVTTTATLHVTRDRFFFKFFFCLASYRIRLLCVNRKVFFHIKKRSFKSPLSRCHRRETNDPRPVRIVTQNYNQNETSTNLYGGRSGVRIFNLSPINRKRRPEPSSMNF